MAEETAGLISGPAPELDPAERRLLAAMPLHAITTDQAITVLSQVDGLGISFDPSHLQVTTGDVTDAARRLGPYVIIAALKDAQGIPSDFRFGPLGSGDIDFPAMIHALAEAGFAGDLVVEHEAHVFGDRRGPAAVLADSYGFAEKLIHATLPRSRT